MESELAFFDVKTLNALFAKKSLSPNELLDEVLQRIETYDPTLNAFALVDEPGARQAATASEKRWLKGEALGPLDGIPTTIKDLIWSSKWPTSYGSRVLGESQPAPADAPCVSRLREAGAVLIGMTTTPELGWKAVTDSRLHGVTRNPWDSAKTPGGSSGGAAAAAAAGLGYLHIGTDGGGSIRIPASFTGTVGHKPSFGRVPAYPPSAFRNVAHVGPIARSVEDAATMLTVLSLADARDWYALPAPIGEPFENKLNADLRGLRIAYSETLGYVDNASAISSCVRRAIGAFEALGAHVEQVDPGFACPQDIFHTLWFSGAAYRLSSLAEDERQMLDPGLREIADEGARISKNDYLHAIQLRAELGAHMCQFHQNYDLLITPTLPIVAFTAGLEVPKGNGNSRWTEWAGFSYPFNLTQQPACSVPCGLSGDGLPIGLQIVGPMFADDLVLRAAHAYESTREWQFSIEPINAITENKLGAAHKGETVFNRGRNR